MKKFSIFIILLFILFFSAQAQELNVEIKPESVGQGKTLVIYLESPGTLKNLEAEFLEKEIRFYEVGKYRYRAILGIPLTTESERHNILFRIKTEDGLKIEWKETVPVKKRVFKKEFLSIPPEKSKHLTSKYLGKEGRKIRKVYKREERKQLWEGRFILPAEGWISSPFGAYRVYNKGKASWRHKGVDIANLEGTEILAPNSGIVVFSKDMKVHGGTIIVSHGQGIFSILSHLKERLVRKGEGVKRGQLIGLMGQTGLATGSHLHWGLCASGVVVDPLEWTKKKIGD